MPGSIVLFGSGETLPPSGKAHEYVAKKLQPGFKLSILETPAGFEPNSSTVAGAVGDFLSRRLQNFQPDIHIIPARKKGTPFSPNNPDLLKDMLDADWLFMGPGSPTYAVRQLAGTLALQYMLALHRLGMPVSLASAAVLAISAQTLPVYEIYKVGEDLHWKKGLDFLGAYGLECIFIPHWDNNDGGKALDTSRCYMGQDRFNELIIQLPKTYPIAGIDEHTSLVIDFENDCGCVLGKGSVTLIDAERQEHVFAANSSFSLTLLGEYFIPKVDNIVPSGLMDQVMSARGRANKAQIPDDQIKLLVEEREAAREQRNWEEADRLRKEIAAMGWELRDTPNGPELLALSQEKAA